MSKFKTTLERFIFPIIFAVSFIFILQFNILNPKVLFPGLKRLLLFASDLFPPNFSILPLVLSAMWETVQISLAGTILGFIFAMPLAFFGTSTLFGPAVTATIRSVIGAIRTIPSILFGVIFVVAFGLGPQAGVWGVALYTVGYLGKLYYEAFEAVDQEVIEAVRSTKCNRVQLMRFAILPEAANTIISQMVFMFEYNIRSSTIMGFVGAGGIGYYMLGYLQMLQYRNLLTTLIVTFLVVMLIDYLSFRLRSLLVVAVSKK